MAEFLADFVFLFYFPYRKTALENLTIAFNSELSKEQKLKVARQAMRSLGKTMVDFLRYSQYDKSQLLSFCKRVEGFEHFEKALQESQGGIIGLSCHLGSWEYSGAWFAASGFHLAAVSKEQPDHELTKLMLKLRRGVGIEHIPKTKKGTKAIIEALNSKKILGLLSDQNGGSSGIFIPFFGKLASTVRGPAKLAMKKKLPVLLMVALWEGYDYVIHIEPPIEIISTGDEEADLYENTRRCQAEIEKMVRKYPEQWLWGHRRWKTRPPDENKATSVV